MAQQQRKSFIEKAMVHTLPLVQFICFVFALFKIPSHLEDASNVIEYGTDNTQILEHGHNTFWWVSLFLMGTFFIAAWSFQYYIAARRG